MLKSLELAGFKSFADKTRLDFPLGMTVVVGPNGSGKSNVVDAVKWVLGSQSPRSLRGKEMTDVIFNGSASRRPQNTAEVTLTFNNPFVDLEIEGERGDHQKKRQFDVDEGELRLTRRIYRSGEGEYLINGRTSRLKDFRELLAGTGVGLDSYSIIEQGRVDAALQASPLERRGLFEEAAGISRFRIKKREAAKRLDRVDQNLLRLSDIVDEVEGRLRRVRSQAGKAQKYREQKNRLQEVRTQLGLADWRALTTEWHRIDQQQTAYKTSLATTRQQIKALEELTASPEKETITAADRLQEADAQLATLREQLARDTSVIEYEGRRVRDLETEAARHRASIVSLGMEAIARRDEQTDPGTNALGTAEQADNELALALRQAKQKADESVTAVTQLRERLAIAQAANEQLTSQRSQRKANQERLTERIASTERAITETEKQIAAAHTSEATVKATLSKAIVAYKSDAELLAVREAELLATQTDLTTVRQTLSDQRHQSGEIRGKRTATAQRLNTLVAEEQRLESLNQDIHALLEHAEKVGATPPTVFGLVADLLNVDVDLATMIEAALGDKTNHIVVDSGDALIAALKGKQNALSSRAGFQRLDAPGSVAAVDRIDLNGEPGVMGRADDFVESEPQFEPLLQRLLGRTWFVDTMETAVRLAQSVGRGLTFVTHAGEVIGADGAIFVGPGEDIDSVLTRRREAQRRRQEAEDLKRQAAAVDSEVKRLKAQAAELEAEQSRLQTAVANSRTRLGSASKEAAALEERHRHAHASCQQQAEALIKLRAKLAGLVAEEKSLRGSQDSSAKEAAQRCEAVAVLSAKLAQAETTLTAESTRRDEIAAAWSRHQRVLESLRSGTGIKKEASTDSDSVRMAIEVANEAWRVAERDRRTSQLETLQATSRIATCQLERQEWNAVRRAAAEEDRTARGQQRTAAASLRTLRKELEELLSHLAQVELRRQQIELERRTLTERMREDYDIDLAAIAALNPSEATESFAEAPLDRESLRREADALRQQVNAVGSVNLESLEELEDLETRFEQLSEQYTDLSKAKTTLVRLMSKINTDSRSLYLASFEVIRGHFRELFARLFGGGEADLVLVAADQKGMQKQEEGDPLEMGVEIVACPPGKELRSLSLLSGGEKTMTCVALLLALFRSKPSPFCILDEVDAALDEANIGRFTSVLTEFLTSTQFIVVTHSKRTMVGADTLYGVTMQESGVSKQVSVRFEDVSEDGHIRTAPFKEASDRKAA